MMPFPMIFPSSFISRKKSPGVVQAILCFFLVALFVSISNAAEVTQITLSWDPNDEPDLAGYNVYRRTADNVYRKPLDMVGIMPNPEYSLTLPYGKKYYFVVSAFNMYGIESPYSNEVSWPIQVLSPNGREILASGDTYPIQWYADPKAVKFRLLYSMDKGKSWMDINQDDYVTGTNYNWTVPAQRSNKKACLVKVIGYDSSNKKVGEDRSDTPFSMEVIRLATPNGGEHLISIDPCNITWETNVTVNPIEEVRLFLTKDGGITWDPIDTLAGNPESYGWIVPEVIKKKTKCKVKVVLKDAGGVTVGSDTSDAYFVIYP